ncbi:conserved oligomeric Golgi complex subunit 2-like [Zophobas morio]|uniref:conserved oligomeric Golgi complex subunit 2-like n=1 Tax=Zophobas morio TaxID=2755281 RepID=UPI003083628D
MGKWTLSVYYQLRYQEIAGILESSLYLKENVNHSKYMLSVSESLIRCCRLVWNKSLFLPPLLHRFWKLFLQLFSRFDRWLKDLVPDSSQKNLNTILEDKHTMFLLHDLLALSNHLPELHENILNDLHGCLDEKVREKFSCLLSECSPFKMLTSQATFFQSILKNSIMEQCERALNKTYTITSLFRGQAQDMPSSQSYFASDILKPLKEVVDASLLPQGILLNLKTEVLEEITEHYYAVISEILCNVESTEKSLLALRKIRKINHKTGPTDEDRIKKQLCLDVTFHLQQVIFC